MEIQLSWIEWLGFASAIIYIYFSINKKIWLWPTGILSSLFYIGVFFIARLYADMILQVYYLIVSIYGWIIWKSKHNNEDENEFKIIKVSKEIGLKIFGVFVLLYVLLALVLLYLPSLIGVPSSDMPYLDAFTTAGSFVATWMLVKKMIEQWLLWIVIDAVALGMYIYKGLYFTSILFLIYTIMAIWGYYAWRKDLKLQIVTIN